MQMCGTDRLTISWSDGERLTYQLFADRLDGRLPSLSLRALNVGQAYFVAVEAFNETGVSPLSRVVPLAASCNGG
jgi:hypothetical protein